MRLDSWKSGMSVECEMLKMSSAIGVIYLPTSVINVNENETTKNCNEQILYQ